MILVIGTIHIGINEVYRRIKCSLADDPDDKKKEIYAEIEDIYLDNNGSLRPIYIHPDVVKYEIFDLSLIRLVDIVNLC